MGRAIYDGGLIQQQFHSFLIARLIIRQVWGVSVPISSAISRCFNSPPTFTATADANFRPRQGPGVAPHLHPAEHMDGAVAQEPHGNGLIDSRQNPVPAPVEQVRFPEFAHALGVNLDLPSRRQ